MDETRPIDPRPSTAAGVGRAGKMLRAAMALYVLATFAVMGVWKPVAFFGVDYGKHWHAARALLEGKSLYLGGDLWMGFNYPQAAAIPFFWLGFFSQQTGEYLWKALLLILSVGCGALAWRWYRPGPPGAPAGGAVALIRAGIARHWGLTVALMTSAYYPVTTCVYLGNIDPVNAILAVGMVAALLGGAPLTAGVVWGMLTLVKMMPLALIVPVLLWRQWRVLHGFLAAMLVYFFVLAALGRVGEEWFFVREAVPIVPLWWRWISISPVACVLRNCGLTAVMEDPHAFMTVVRLSEAALLAIYLGLLVALARRRAGWLRGLEAAIVFYPIFSPLLEYHHFVWIMPVFFLQARRFAAGGLGVGLGTVLLAGWVWLCATYHLIDLAPRRYVPHELIHFAALPGYFVVLGGTLWDAWRAGPMREFET